MRLIVMATVRSRKMNSSVSWRRQICSSEKIMLNAIHLRKRLETEILSIIVVLLHAFTCGVGWSVDSSLGSRRSVNRCGCNA
mmetsp:Transcript_25976/g.37043  ORF Transcript_25976/g.37043 Transcript_25976/m.37043 type:complete len:82 (+) Transcript_25976:624-869(+)